MIIHDPGNTKKVDVIYAWLSVDENGNEGIVVTNTVDPEGSKIALPLVTWEGRHVFMLNRLASQSTDKNIKMFKFKRVTD